MNSETKNLLIFGVDGAANATGVAPPLFSGMLVAVSKVIFDDSVFIRILDNFFRCG